MAQEKLSSHAGSSRQYAEQYFNSAASDFEPEDGENNAPAHWKISEASSGKATCQKCILHTGTASWFKPILETLVSQWEQSEGPARTLHLSLTFTYSAAVSACKRKHI